MSKQVKQLAKCVHADIVIEDHGIPFLQVDFDYEDGGSQGLGVYQLDSAFVMRFMCAIGVITLSDAPGKSCWVVQGEDGMISEVHPLHKKNGIPFIIKDWQEWVAQRTIAVSAHELRTGEDPARRE